MCNVHDFYKMNLKKIVNLIYFLITINFSVHYSLHLTALYQLQGRNAKTRFCSQKFFDSLSYDGEKYKFSVNQQKIVDHSLGYSHFVFEVFSLKYNPRSKSFTYQSSTFDHDNCEFIFNIFKFLFKLFLLFFFLFDSGSYGRILH